MRPLILTTLVSFAAMAQAQPILIAPTDLTVPSPTSIHIEKLDPGASVTVETLRRSEDGKETFVASGQFTANQRGRIDLSRAAPDSGSYRGVDPLGIFWSAKVRPIAAEDPANGTVRIRAMINGKTVGSAVARTRPDPALFTIRADTPFAGAVWAVPKGRGPHPVIIVLGGSEGGSSTARDVAPLFAARGYATLGLPYYDPGFDPNDKLPSLPKNFIEIPVDRIADVKKWLDQQVDVDTRRIGIWGASKGAEFALIAASRYDWIKTVTAVVPTDLVWEGWGVPGPSRSSFAFDGKPLPFQPYGGMEAEYAKAAKGERMDIGKVHRQGRIAFPDRIAAARIPIERFRGELLVIGGGRDKVWPSGEMAANIVATRRAAGLPTAAVIAPEAGHSLGGPGTEPVAPMLPNGGEGAAIAKARADGWRATFKLFDRALRP
jgi:dienelactone hydrolase